MSEQTKLMACKRCGDKGDVRPVCISELWKAVCACGRSGAWSATEQAAIDDWNAAFGFDDRETAGKAAMHWDYANKIPCCPFCGSESQHMFVDELSVNEWSVHCGVCRAEGPICDTPELAVGRWGITKEGMVDREAVKPIDATNAPEKTALIRRCNVCRHVTAIDIENTPEHRREMELPGQTIEAVTRIEAEKHWYDGGPCTCKRLPVDGNPNVCNGGGCTK